MINMLTAMSSTVPNYVNPSTLPHTHSCSHRPSSPTDVWLPGLVNLQV